MTIYWPRRKKPAAVRRAPVSFRPEARDDLIEIFRLILRLSGSTSVARNFVERIRDRCNRIGLVPEGGYRRDDLEPGLRTVPFERSAVVAYRFENGRVRITNVFYGGRDYEALYRGRGDEAPDRWD